MAGTAKQQLDFFIDKYTPEIAALARAVLKKMRERLPGAIEMVYDNTYALAIGFSPTDRPSDAVFSIVLYPRYLHLYFLHGAALPDPEGRLQGAGKIGRHIILEDAATLDDPVVRSLMEDALELSEVPYDPRQPRKIVIRSVAAKQRPRRPAAKRAARC